MTNIKFFAAAAASSLAIGAAANTAYGQSEPLTRETGVRLSWRIPPQPLADALIAWSEQSEMIVLLRDDLVSGVETKGLQGTYSKLEALDRLLKPAGLAFRIDGAKTLVLAPALHNASYASAERPDAARPGALAENLSMTSIRAEPLEGGRAGHDAEEDAKENENGRDWIVVTGTRIRGALPAAPIETITRLDIERSGQSQAGELLRALPQTFRGGLSPTVQPTTIAGNSGLGGDSTVNLRGMGADATLVLVNGRRLAPVSGGETTDISAIPLAALERVDVLLDGSSALYGADAVAGVINFIVTDDYDGAELRARAGGTTQGGGFEHGYSAAAGHRWNSGSLILGGDFLEQNDILAGERDFSKTAGPLNALSPDQRQWSAFMSGRQDLAGGAALDILGLYTDRKFARTTEYGAGGFADAKENETRTFLIAPRVLFDLPAGWSAQIEGSLSRSVRDSEANDNFGGRFAARTQNGAWTVGASAEGAIASLPSGDLRAAIGGGYRAESLNADLGGAPRNGTRTVSYAFAESSLPLVAPSDQRTGLNSLDLNFAIRIEDHSGFGVAATPKLGVRYAPLPDLAVRATWGKSFKAPRFDQLLADNVVTLWDAASLGGASPGLALLDFGGNPALEPERAQSWTAGFDFAPRFLSGFDLSFTWFDIDFTDRIVSPIVNLGSALSDPVNLPFIDFNPSPAAQAALIDGADRFLPVTGSPYDPDAVVGIVHSGFVNAAAQRVSGADVSVNYATGDIALFANLSWLQIDAQTLAALPLTRQSGFIFQPPSFRMRSGASWEAGDGLTLNAIVNHVAGSRDNVASPPDDIASWTTLDLTLQYELEALSPALDGFNASLSVINALDKDPPFAAGAGVAFSGMFFDSANTSPVGRFIAATLRYRF